MPISLKNSSVSYDRKNLKNLVLRLEECYVREGSIGGYNTHTLRNELHEEASKESTGFIALEFLKVIVF